ncbi:MAG: hypothetical protein ACT4OV_14430 [Microthrixaceae bacterium]
MRVRRIARLIALVVTGLLVAAGPSAAQDDHDDGTSTTAPAPEGSVGIGDGIYLTKAVVVAPDGTTRSLDARQAAVFVQSWLASAFFGGPEIVADPPSDLPVYRVDSTGIWGTGGQGTVSAYYATDGTTPYIGFPGMVVWSDPSEIPPPGQWFTAPTRVIDTFQGKGELQDTLGIDQDKRGPVTTGGDAPAAADDSTPVWVAIVAGALAVVGGGWVWFRRRRSSP